MLAYFRRTEHRVPVALQIGAALAVVFGAATAGCGDKLRDKTHPRLLSSRDVSHYVTEALESPLPDRRRVAVNRLARAGRVDTPEVLKALAHLAVSDRSPTVRVAAVFALRRSASPVAAETCFDILAAPAALPDSGAIDVRAAAMETLHQAVAEGRLSPEAAEDVRRVAIEMLGNDLSRNVRLAAAQTLGYCPHADALTALVAGLDQRDFGVCYEAERALMRLTGRTHDHDPEAWRAFLASVDDPFADRGRLDEKLAGGVRRWYWPWK